MPELDALRLDRWQRKEGRTSPLGATWLEHERAMNFALYSRHATSLSLLCYTEADPVRPCVERRLDPRHHKTGRVWHCLVPEADLGNAAFYAYRVDGPREPWNGDRFDPEKILLDPYARGVFFPPNFDRGRCCQPGKTDGCAPLGVLPDRTPPSRPAWSRGPRHGPDAIVYELHVKGFTSRENSGVSRANRGKFAGIKEKIPYLKELGVTVVELMPIHQFDPQEGNYWGYMTLNFFSPHGAYATADPVREFRELVDALHAADIGVWLDVVYNHTSEGSELGPTYGLRGFDNRTYYLTNPDRPEWYLNDSGCGNTTRCAHHATRELIIDSLDYWAGTMGVDGFRFDLASVFSLSSDGRHDLPDPPIIAEIEGVAREHDMPLVAEAWDVNSYQLGRSYPGFTWGQWNGKFRDDVRCFVKGDPGLINTLITRLYGSDDLFPDVGLEAYRPYQSVNYVASHDGLNLCDLVSYTHDGQLSWDCGWRGEDGVPADVMVVRRQQVKNFCALLMLANGTPMFVAGDEFMNTQQGNDNPYNQDNEVTWLDWDRLDRNAEVFRFFQHMIAFRKAHPSIARGRFWRDDVQWYGVQGEPDRSPWSRTLAYCLDGASQHDDDLYVMLNAYWSPLTFTVQAAPSGSWLRVVDTARTSPDDILEPGSEVVVAGSDYSVQARSIVVLRRPRA